MTAKQPSFVALPSPLMHERQFADLLKTNEWCQTVWWCQQDDVNKMRGKIITNTWWCHQMETCSVLLALCAGNSPVTVTRSFDVLFDLRLNKRLSKQSWSWGCETPLCSLWCHCNVNKMMSTSCGVKSFWLLPIIFGIVQYDFQFPEKALFKRRCN